MYGKTGIAPSISHKYPTYRDVLSKSGLTWLAGRREDEEAEGLWRIYDNLYDFTDFIKNHPGGEDWLVWTKGCDITEAFEVHHITASPNILLPKYFVRKAKNPRNIKLTMHENGFYKVLKKRIGEKVATLDHSKRKHCEWIIDSLFVITLTLAVFTAKLDSYLLSTVTGVFLTWTVICAHNFFHQKDNMRMKLFNLGFLSYREWRISHALSHHIYPNTLHDLEISYLEPFLNWTPSEKVKMTSFLKYIYWIISPIAYALLFYHELGNRIIRSTFSKDRIIYVDDVVVPLLVPVAMTLVGGQDIFEVTKLWLYMILVASFVFGLIGINAAHHHPEAYHEGDAHNPTMDWGIFTMDTVMDREDLQGNIILTLPHFGDHCLHHLFPTIDHALLPELYDTLFATCKEFETELRTSRWWDLITGQFEQLLRTEPNPVPVILRKKKL